MKLFWIEVGDDPVVFSTSQINERHVVPSIPFALTQIPSMLLETNGKPWTASTNMFLGITTSRRLQDSTLCHAIKPRNATMTLTSLKESTRARKLIWEHILLQLTRKLNQKHLLNQPTTSLSRLSQKTTQKKSTSYSRTTSVLCTKNLPAKSPNGAS